MRGFKFKAWQASILAVCLLVGSLGVWTGVSASAQAPGKYALVLDGVVVGWLNGAVGGNATADVINESATSTASPKKHLGTVKYEDITITVGAAGMPAKLYQWVKESLANSTQRKSGAIVTMDYQGRELNRLTFTNALITEVTLPAMDTASKIAPIITIKLSPESTRRTISSGAALSVPAAKAVLSTFRLTIDGLDQATNAVSRIKPLVVKRDQATSKFVFPNPVVTVPETSSQPLYDWLDSFVIRGNNSDKAEKNGTLDYISADGKETLFTVTFSHLGVVKVYSDEDSAARLTTAEMYVESMSFK